MNFILYVALICKICDSILLLYFKGEQLYFYNNVNENQNKGSVVCYQSRTKLKQFVINGIYLKVQLT